MSALVTVVGTIFMDCKGFAQTAYHPAGRNLGTVRFVHGGVGRNVAENLARLGVPVALASSVDASGLGDEIVGRLEQAGVRTEYVLRASSRGMGMWLAILDENGNLAGSISHMPDLDHFRELVASRGEQFVRQSSHIAIEMDLDEQITGRVIELARKHNRPVYGIPGNLDVISKHPELLRGMECFICNDIEGSKLTGTDLTQLDTAALRQRLAAFADSAGLRSMVMTLGAKGAVYYDAAAQQSGHQPVFPVRVVDTTGAGDAFFSGTVMGLVRGLPLRDAVVCGTKVAGWTIESAENNCQELGERVQQDELLQKLL